MRPDRFELYVGELRILRHISESSKIGRDELSLQLHDDPACGALGAILRNLATASFVQFESQNCVAATPAGRAYLKEHPTNG
jgi:hypothetical protein